MDTKIAAVSAREKVEIDCLVTQAAREVDRTARIAQIARAAAVSAHPGHMTWAQVLATESDALAAKTVYRSALAAQAAHNALHPQAK